MTFQWKKNVSSLASQGASTQIIRYWESNKLKLHIMKRPWVKVVRLTSERGRDIKKKLKKKPPALPTACVTHTSNEVRKGCSTFVTWSSAGTLVSCMAKQSSCYSWSKRNIWYCLRVEVKPLIFSVHSVKPIVEGDANLGASIIWVEEEVCNENRCTTTSYQTYIIHSCGDTHEKIFESKETIV